MVPESHMVESEEARRRQELAEEGQRHLEEAIAAAFQILTSINHELCNPHPTSAAPTAADSDASCDAAGGGGSGGAAPGPGGSLDEARYCYKTAVAALRASITDPPSLRRLDQLMTKQMKLRLGDWMRRKEIESKNKNVKLLMDQLRDLILDVSVWHNPCSV